MWMRGQIKRTGRGDFEYVRVARAEILEEFRLSRLKQCVFSQARRLTTRSAKSLRLRPKETAVLSDKTLAPSSSSGFSLRFHVTERGGS